MTIMNSNIVLKFTESYSLVLTACHQLINENIVKDFAI